VIYFLLKGGSMYSRDNTLNVDVDRLKKMSFKSAKFLEKGKFQSYVTCGEVVKWSMEQFFKEYIPAVVRTWCGIIGFVFELIGIISVASGITILLPSWVWVSIGIIALIWAQFLVYDKVRKERDEARNKVASAILDLESNTIMLGGKAVNMGTLFWKTGESFLEGILPRSIPGSIYSVVQGANKKDCDKAFDNLKSRLRLLGLIDDKQRQIRSTGYKEIQTTPLGASVLNELEKRYRDMNWRDWGSEGVPNKEGGEC
jgi:hypothetical protein